MTKEDGMKTTRRGFLKAAAAGAAAVGVAAAAPAAAIIASDFLPQISDAGGLGSDEADRLVAYVRDPAKGEIVLMMGTKEVVLRDFGLVTHLARLAAG